MEWAIIQDIKHLIKLHDLEEIEKYYIDIIQKKNIMLIFNIFIRN